MGDSFQIALAKPKHEDELRELEKAMQIWQRSQYYPESTKSMRHNRVYKFSSKLRYPPY